MATGRPQADARPESPCVGLCQLDAARICLGCGRHIDEVVEWSFADDGRKREILRAARRRISMIKTGHPPADDPAETR